MNTNEQMPQFYDIPNEVLHRNFFPKLDYNTRAALNQCLPLEMRYAKRFPKRECDAHFYTLQLDAFKRKVDIFRDYNGSDDDTLEWRDNQLRMWARMFTWLAHPRSVILYQCAGARFRKAIQEKIAYSTDVITESHSAYQAVVDAGKALEALPIKPDLPEQIITVD